VHSFECDLEGDRAIFGKTPCRAVLIRAPMITQAGPETQTLLAHQHAERGRTPVLLRQGNILVTFASQINTLINGHDGLL
jgi:glutamine amidotransferase PdxT